MTTETQTELGPIHETIVPVIRSARTPEELTLLGELILCTKFPSNHDAIAEAFTETVDLRLLRMGDTSESVIEKVVPSLMVQKKASEKEKEPPGS